MIEAARLQVPLADRYRVGFIRGRGAAYGELVGNRRIAQATGDDVTAGAALLLSLFMRDPQFQGQTKERLASAEAAQVAPEAKGPENEERREDEEQFARSKRDKARNHDSRGNSSQRRE